MPFIDAIKHDTLTSVRSKTFIYITHFFGIISEYILHIIYIISKQRYEYSYLVESIHAIKYNKKTNYKITQF